MQVINREEQKEKPEGIFKIFLAAAFIIVGCSLLLSALGLHFLGISYIWPLFMLIPVIPMGMAFVREPKKAVGVMIPIVILTYYAAFFIVCNYTDWRFINFIWPNFLLGPGIAFVVMFYLTRKSEFLIPAGILILLAIIFFGTLFDSHLLSGVSFIVVGLLLIFSFFVKSKKE